MIPRLTIQRYAEEIARRFQPQRIVLFGSYASGNATEDSDVDLLVIMPLNGSPVDQAVRIRSAIPRAFPLDLIVRDWPTVRARAEANDGFFCEALTNGIVLYEAADARVA